MMKRKADTSALPAKRNDERRAPITARDRRQSSFLRVRSRRFSQDTEGRSWARVYCCNRWNEWTRTWIYTWRRSQIVCKWWPWSRTSSLAVEWRACPKGKSTKETPEIKRKHKPRDSGSWTWSTGNSSGIRPRNIKPGWTSSTASLVPGFRLRSLAPSWCSYKRGCLHMDGGSTVKK